ncbi:addiction module antitoxin RelB, partial [Candidatus Uhrbacteria bacterium]|nr:addiction module antitoxin RelB [Candidatus Uhrbacteria bacterium]
MTELNERVIRDALSLPVDRRVGLVEILLKSLNVPTKSDIDAAWAAEAERRVKQIEEGDVKTISGEDV